MTSENLRQLPGFMAAWADTKPALLTFLRERVIDHAAANKQESGQQTLALLIRELEKLDSAAPPTARPTMKPLLTS